jgi:hypothetical protein
MHDKLIELFFFSEKTVTSRSYLDIPELYVLLQLPQTILQQDAERDDWGMDRQK